MTKSRLLVGLTCDEDFSSNLAVPVHFACSLRLFTSPVHFACSLRLAAALFLLGLLSGESSAQGIATHFTPSGVSGGGRLLSASLNPLDPDQALLVCDMMGLYRTMDEGLRWQLVPTDAFATSLRTRMSYTGTAGNQRIYGIRRLNWGSNKTIPAVSINGGLTWTDLAQPTGTPEVNQYYSLAADPGSTSAATQRLVMDNYDQLWFTASGGDTGGSWTPIPWKNNPSVPNIPGISQESIRLAGAAWFGSTIYVGASAGVFVSTNNGASWGSTTYVGLPSGSQIVEFCGARHPDNPSQIKLFAILINNLGSFDGNGPQVQGWHDIRSVDAARYGDEDNLQDLYLGLYTLNLADATPAWTRVDGPNGEKFARVDVAAGNSSQPWAATYPDKPGRVFKGSTTTQGVLSFAQVLPAPGEVPNLGVSTGYQGDGGILSWAWSDPALGLEVSDSNPNRVLVTGDFPYLTDDGGQSWLQVYVSPATENPPGQTIIRPKPYHHSGLGTTTGHWMHWINPQAILSAGTDIGLQRSADAGSTWTTDYTPLKQFDQLDPSNWYCLAKQPGGSRTYAAVSEVNDFYEEERLVDSEVNEKYGDVRYSDNNGLTWTPVSKTGLTGSKFPGPVITVAVDPNNQSHVYAASASSKADGSGFEGGFFRSTDNGSSWTKLASPTGTEGRPLSIHVLGPNQLAVTYCARKTYLGSNLVHTASSGVFYSTNGGTSWEARMDANMAYYTRDLVVHPTNPDRWFVAVQSTRTNDSAANPTFDGRGGVYYSPSRGQNIQPDGNTWVRLMTHNGVQSVCYVPGNVPLLYVTTNNDGLWVIANPEGPNPNPIRINAFPFARVRRVFADPNRNDGTIWVTTQGGGLWRGTVAPSMTSALTRVGNALQFTVVAADAGGSAPVLTGIQNLISSPGGWTVLSGLTPSVTPLPGGWTQYVWNGFETHGFFSEGPGYVRASRQNNEGITEVGEAGGWVREFITSSHTESLGTPWLRPAIVTSTAVAANGPSSSTLYLDGVLPVALPAGQLFVEILEGALEGHRFEINEAVSNTATLVLDLAAAENTSATPPVLNHHRVVVRPHWTLGEVFPKSDYRGTSSASTFDTLNIWGNGAWEAYWRVQSGSLDRWFGSNTGITDQSPKVLRHGVAALVQAKAVGGAPRNTLSYGMVRQTRYRHRTLPVGDTFVSLGFPMPMVLIGAAPPLGRNAPPIESNQMTTANGFVATFSVSTSDRLQKWNGDALPPGTSGYTAFWFFNHPSGPFWTQQGAASLPDWSHSLDFFPRHRGFLTTLITSKSNWIVLTPWTP